LPSKIFSRLEKAVLNTTGTITSSVIRGVKPRQAWTDEEKIEKKGTYRNKVSHPKEYEQQLAISNKFTSTTRMKHVFH